MHYSHQIVELCQIDQSDASFRISTADATPILTNSIEAVGLLNPPTLRAKSERFCIVSGFGRVQACQNLGLKEISARIVSQHATLTACVQHAIIDNTFQRELNIVEQARAVKLLSCVCGEPDELLTTAQQTGLAMNQKMIKKLMVVSQMTDTLHKGLITGAIALPIALQLAAIKDHKILDEISRLLMDLNLSLNRQRELFEWIVAIAKRDHIGIEQLLAEAPIQAVRQNAELDRRQKGAQIRQYLKKRRSPAIVAFESTYQNLLERMQLKKGARLVAPDNFEGPVYSIQMEFTNLDELKMMEKEVHRLTSSPYMSKILNLIGLLDNRKQ
jgi:ParB family transcriptional regulator, chromosome partitioning protein